jgi:hypothetical protein
VFTVVGQLEADGDGTTALVIDDFRASRITRGDLSAGGAIRHAKGDLNVRLDRGEELELADRESGLVLTARDGRVGRPLEALGDCSGDAFVLRRRDKSV